MSLWDGDVPAFLIKGQEFEKRMDGMSFTQQCSLQLDEDAWFLLCKFPQQKEMNVLEMSYIREIRIGLNIKDGKAFNSQIADLEAYSEKIVSVLHGLDFCSLSVTQFIAPSVEVSSMWVNGLNEVMACNKSRHLCFLEILKKQWKRLMYGCNSKGLIPVRRLIKQFGHDKNEKPFLSKIKNAGFNFSKNGEIDPSEFPFEKYQELYDVACGRTEIAAIFDQICNKNKPYVELPDLVTWLNENQRDPRLNEILVPIFDEKRASNIIKQYEPDKKLRDKNCMTLRGFTEYLASKDNSPVYMDHVRRMMNMDQPLCHYFINSSHNTYLTGKQFGGKSSVEIYRNVLLQGCRCIELDCWDGKGDMHGEPMITHGKAMCTDVLFKDVLYAIRDCAFVTSDMPVILSFETHCSKPLQMKMAQYCEEVFGDLLLSKSLEEFPLEAGVPLPSPNALKRKILIKNKRLPREKEQEPAEVEKVTSEETEQTTTTDAAAAAAAVEADGGEANTGASGENCTENNNVAEQEATEGTTEEAATKKIVQSPTIVVNGVEDAAAGDNNEKPRVNAEEGGGGGAPTPAVTPTATTPLTPTSEGEVSTADVKKEGEEEDAPPQEETGAEEQAMANYVYQKTSATNIHPLLSSMVNYCQSVKFPGFKEDDGKTEKMSFHMSSFSETVGLSHLKHSGIEFVDYNKVQLSRIYPKGSRVDSSNYMPQPFWNAGCQLVSLNMQTFDLGVQLNNGKFEFNGNCGYLLKPDVMLATNRVFDPFAESTVDGVIAARCSIKIISSTFVAEKPVSSTVEVDMYGLPNDTIRKEFKTQLVVQNSLNPSYNDNEFNFRKVIFPELALVRFSVLDDSRQLIGQRVMPFSSLQAGYHYISMQSSGGVPLDTVTIFTKITLGSYVPDSLRMIVDALADPRAHLSAMRQHEAQLKMLMDDVDEEEEDPEVEAKPKPTTRTTARQQNGSAAQPAAVRKPSVKNTNSVVAGGQQSGKVGQQGAGGDQQPVNAYSKLYDKTAGDKLMERLVTNEITLGDLISHRTYVDATSRSQMKKSQKKAEKESRKSSRRRQSSTNADVEKSSLCCFPVGKVPAKNKYEVKEESQQQIMQNGNGSMNEETPTDVFDSDMKKKAAMISALKFIHNNDKEEMKKAQEKEMSDLTKCQTKVWMDQKKDVTKDKSVPPAEKERRIKELQSQEVKKFMEERQSLKNRHAKQLSRLDAYHETQFESLSEKIESADGL